MLNFSLRSLAITIAVLLSGCASFVGRPTVTQLIPDPPVFLLAYPLSFSAGDRREQFSVPSGFVTDLASIPRALWWWQAPHESTMAPAIVHDFLYWEQPCTKDEADAVMFVAMKQTGMTDFSIHRVYDGIRTPLAQNAWERNKSARAKGEPRFFTPTFSAALAQRPIDPKATLASIQSEALAKKEVLTAPLPVASIKAVCRAASAEFDALHAH